MGRILAIDYGKKRVGLAVTDPLHITANALETVSTEHIFDYLKQYLARENVEKFVIGLPTQMNGQPSESMQYIQPFADKLSKLFPKQEIVFVDERFSSSLAQKTILEAGVKKKARQNKALVDKVAATIILQSYLSSL
ncbi:MAG TPA: Holliday junction resolvase RuvX [Paludibacter sp.]|jgi:putative Holliday junction resolvase|nr:Holliday junction resolvase RuvX [Bacteroidales bacterium]HOG06368.1 Holliday junction resolvase RuvX [Paludibacter sp.]HPM11652.1 Holliday junction resolvase RuvX [Paludibacter sp.]